MNSIKLYHGTSSVFSKINLEKSRDKRDFGKGFYTTTFYEQAISWANNIYTRYGGENKIVMHFSFEPSEELKIKKFETMSEDWLEFVKENRVNGGTSHNYDVVIGPVANDNTMRTIMFYISGVYTAEMAIQQLKFFKVNNQISFHSEKALKYLRFEKSEVING